MGKKYRRSNSKCPEPINTMLDLLGAAAMGAYTKHKIKKDYAKGQGEESAKAAAMVLGAGSLRRGGKGIISAGGLIGLNSAIKDIQKKESNPPRFHYRKNQQQATVKEHKTLKKYTWRKYCEDGTQYGISPYDYETADRYADALKQAKELNKPHEKKESKNTEDNIEHEKATIKRYTWRKYCTDGSEYGINPEDYETADEYEEALRDASKDN